MNDHDDLGFIADALPAFISEGQEQIASIELLLLQLEDAPDDRELLDALFRCAHTVKGSAGIFGLDAVVAFTHHVETLLDCLREGGLALTPEISTLLLQCNDQIRQLIDQATGGSDGDVAGQATREALVARLDALRPTTAAKPSEPAPVRATADRMQPWQVSARFGADTFRNGMDPLALLAYVGQLGRIDAVQCDLEAVPALEALDPESCHLGFAFEVHTDQGRRAIEAAFSFAIDDTTLQIAEASAAVAEVDSTAMPAKTRDAASAGAAAPADPGRYIRVQADRLDAVINLLGELVIASAGASLLARQTRNGALIEANQQIGTLVEDIRNGTLQLRMVPIGESFSRFRRVVRDTAAELGKDVVLEIVGGETELDKAVVERIADPLMHLVRNALDHGLETPAQRQASGKPAQGKLTLSACHESGAILIRIADDGRGIQRDKVLQRAWDRGLLEHGTTPSDAEIFNLIFEAGFSTAEKVTNLSGRGVGMDVVRSNIEALRGSVTVSSRDGQGSCIEIRLPLTLAIIDGFLVGVGSSRFIFPLDAIAEVVEDRPTATALDARGRSVVELRGRVLPVVSLRSLYALDTPPPERCSVVVVHSGTQRYGVLVDMLLGQHQTVIKPLGRMFRSLRGMSGSSILANGEVALIFDVASLGQLAMEAATPPSSLPSPAPTEGTLS